MESSILDNTMILRSFLCAISSNTNRIANNIQNRRPCAGSRVDWTSPRCVSTGGKERQLRALRKFKREAPKSPFVFVSERGGPFTTEFQSAGEAGRAESASGIQVHAHMLRHAAGFKLAGEGTIRAQFRTWFSRKKRPLMVLLH